jgi:hypothetical protein
MQGCPTKRLQNLQKNTSKIKILKYRDRFIEWYPPFWHNGDSCKKYFNEIIMNEQTQDRIANIENRIVHMSRYL